MNCPHCQSLHVVKNGTKPPQIWPPPIQRYRCHNCRRVFNERTGTPMVGLRTAAKGVTLALKMRSEGIALRVLGYSHFADGVALIVADKTPMPKLNRA